MPLPSVTRTAQKAELKYNVVTEYPDFHLHSAAANGNLALVHYALTQGQPVNSALEGLLPLHAAASNGSELVVTRLLDAGADVNAPRLPLRYNNEKAKSGSVIVGTAGCTPLHFAAANGHLPIVRLLLSRGADPLRADKHGVRPEDVAIDYGYQPIVDLLREASEAFEPPSPSSRQPPASPSRSRILSVQRSINDSLSMRKPSLHSLGGRSHRNDSSDSAAERPVIRQSLSQEPGTTPYSPGRRPSLPVLSEKPPSRTQRIKRPTSAGQGGGWPDQSEPTRHNNVGYPEPTILDQSPTRESGEDHHGSLRKATSKYTLANIFKKSGDVNTSDGTRSSSDSSSTRDNNSSLARALDEVFTAPAIPSKVGNTPWYRPRKSSEVVVSSPLALESTVLREHSPEPSSSSPVSDAASNGRARSSSAPVAENSPPNPSIQQQLQQPVLQLTPKPSRQLNGAKSMEVREQPILIGTQANAPPISVVSNSTTGLGKALPQPPNFLRATSDPVPTMATLLQPTLDDPARLRGDSMSSNSEASSRNARSSSAATVSTASTPITPPSPKEQSLTPTIPRRASVSVKRPPPLTLHGVSSRAEALALVEQARQDIVGAASASTGQGGSAPSGRTLAEQLELYGRTLQLERHFARGEAQKHGRHPSRRPDGAEESDGDDAAVIDDAVRGGTTNGGSPPPSSSSSSELTASQPHLSAVHHVKRSGSKAHIPRTTLVRSASTSTALSRYDTPHSGAPAASTRSKKHRPIANMSYLQHKHSLEARLNRQYQATTSDLDEDDDDDLEHEVGNDEEDEFGVLVRPPVSHHRSDSSRRRSSNIEIIRTLPTPTDSPVSIASESVLALTAGNTEPLFKVEEGSPIYQSPLANVGAPPPERPARTPVPRPTNAFTPNYIPPSENAFPPRSQLNLTTSRSDSPSRSTSRTHIAVRRPSALALDVEAKESAAKAIASEFRSLSPPPDRRRSEDVVSPSPSARLMGSSATTSSRRFGLRTLVSTLTKR